MASKALTAPLIRHIAKKGYASAACPQPATPIKIKCETMPSKTVVAYLNNDSPVARICVAFKAGARYEPITEPGLTHVLRSAAGLSTGAASSFIMSRQLAQVGATFTCSGDREIVYYTLEANQDALATALEVFINVITKQEFRPWELDDNAARLKYDIASVSPQARAMDLAHNAAFRRGLGNSLYVPKRRIGDISTESLLHFTETALTADRCAIALVGNGEDKASILTQSLKMPISGCAKDNPTTYLGGDRRIEKGGDLAHVVLAVKGAAANKPESLALSIASKALGNGPVTKWGTDNSVLGKAIGNIGPFAAAGFNISYSDAGLYGVVLSVPKDEANKAVRAVSTMLKAPKLCPEDIRAAKEQLKLQILSEAEQGTTLAESLVTQCLYTGKVKNPADLAHAVAAVTDESVIKAASEAGKYKISIGAIGNLVFVPYADEL